MRERPLSFTFESESATLSFSGVVDEESVGQFRHEVEGAVAEAGGVLRIDLSDVDYFPSVALNVVMQAIKTTRSRPSVEVVAAPGSIADRVLTLTGVPHQEQ